MHQQRRNPVRRRVRGRKRNPLRDLHEELHEHHAYPWHALDLPEQHLYGGVHGSQRSHDLRRKLLALSRTREQPSNLHGYTTDMRQRVPRHRPSMHGQHHMPSEH